VLFSSVTASAFYFLVLPNTEAFELMPLISLAPVVSSLFSALLLNDSQAHAMVFTRVNVSALFLLLVGMNAALLLGLS